MSPIWMVPALVAVLGGLVIAALVRQAASAAGELATELARLSEISAAMATVERRGRRSGATVASHTPR
ncbi:MAG TPA: hypothetical protein VMN58_04055 [Acidimicrobiales bacterium]|nr:hypothetical protein [Acidimicrobiales bacterium]